MLYPVEAMVALLLDSYRHPHYSQSVVIRATPAFSKREVITREHLLLVAGRSTMADSALDLGRSLGLSSSASA